MKHRQVILFCSVFMAMLLLCGVTAMAADAPPPFPAAYWGSVIYTDGSQVSSGTVEAVIDGAVCGSINFSSGMYGAPDAGLKLIVQGADISGKTVKFRVNGTYASQTATWKSDDTARVDLTIQKSEENGGGTTTQLALQGATLPAGTVGQSYDGYTFSATGGTAPYSYAVTSGTLPAGLTLANGTISGTPTANGTSNFTITVTDSTPATANQSFSITINQATPSSPGGGSSGGGGTPSTTSTEKFTKGDVDKQIANNTTKIVVKLKDVIEIEPEAMAKIASANKDIQVKNEAEKAGITIPAGAVELLAGASLKVSFEPVSAKNSSSFSIGLPTGGKMVSKIFDISAMNVKTGVESKVEFKKPISITLPYDPDAVEQGAEDNLVAYWFNPSTNSWVSMGGTVDKTAKTVTFTTDHLSVYALMVRNVIFADTAGHWAQSDIEAMAALHVVKGGPDGLFRPNSNITRSEFSAMLVRLLGIEPQQNGELKFNDVNNNKWYYGVVAAAYSNGLIQGYDENSFGPEDNITREQLATMVTRAYVFRGGAQPDNALAESKLTVFDDRTDISSWAVNSTAMAVDKKIINGYPDGKFKPSASATRAEALVMLKRLLNVLKK